VTGATKKDTRSAENVGSMVTFQPVNGGFCGKTAKRCYYACELNEALKL
jgi:hypothetical protein